MGADDFGEIGVLAQPKADAGVKRKAADSGAPREYLKIFETLSPQLLNAFGESKFMKLDDQTVPPLIIYFLFGR